MIDAVLDRDLLKIIEDFQLLGKFNAGLLRCPNCNKVITYENIGAFKVLNEEIRIYCDDFICLNELIEED